MSDISATHTAPGLDEKMGFESRVPYYRQRVDEELSRWLDSDTVADDTLLQAMQYALLGEGKRIRPLLVYASGELLDIDAGQLDAVAAAVEMIHSYSLVHDDLPAMDNDDLRRGRPTVHVAYDEATAILVGDALQSLAFQVITEHPALLPHPSVGAALVRQLARAAGPEGMVAGQALDLAFSGRRVQRGELEDMFARKTGRLIGAAITLPLECVRGTPEGTRQILNRFASKAGLCFQIHDDILDLTGGTDQIGKPSGSDVRNDRAAYPVRFGIDAAHARESALFDEALECLEELGSGAEGLRWITEYIVKRDH